MQDQTAPETQNQPEPVPAPGAPTPETKPQENIPLKTPQELPPEPKPPESAVPAAPDFRAKVLEGKKKKLETKLQELLDLARGRGKISNNDIEKHLNVSDATATRYAQILLRRGTLKKSGRTKGIFYEPI